MTEMTRVLPEERRPRLKQLLAAGAPVRAIEFHDVLSALIGENARGIRGGSSVEFDALWASGFANATAMGLPDAELSLLERRFDTLADVMTRTHKPVIVDVDTGRDALNLSLVAARLEYLGVSALVVEDKEGAKRTSLAHGVRHALAPPAEFVAKLAMVRSNLRTRDLMIFARTESLIAGAGLDDALARARLYLAGDADGLVIHSKDRTGEEILRFLDALEPLFASGLPRKPVVCIPTAYHHLTDTELFGRGASLVIHANHLIRAALQSMSAAAATILASDRSLEADVHCAPLRTVLDFVGTGS